MADSSHLPRLGRRISEPSLILFSKAEWIAGKRKEKLGLRGLIPHLLPPSGNWLLKLLLSKTSDLQPGKGPEEKEDNKGQKHSDGGQKCPQEAELQRVGEKGHFRAVRCALEASLPTRMDPGAEVHHPTPVDQKTSSVGTGDGTGTQGGKKIPIRGRG